ncbi:MAG TPA: hypothetical protein V6C88_07395 [Chroococcidiopsis sp.]
MDRSAKTGVNAGLKKIGIETAEAIAYHGWGYESSCWAEWAARLATLGISLAAADRGYFGPPSAPAFGNADYRIILAHSYGLHLCPLEQLQQADLLVIFSSFVEFHPSEPRARRRSQRVLEQMIQACQHDSQTVLQQFRLQCGETAEQVAQLPQVSDHELLNRDLQELHHSHINVNHLQRIPAVMIFHGAADRIVPIGQGRDLATQITAQIAAHGAHADCNEIQDAEHCLPFSHIEVCWQRLKLHLEAIAP